MIEPTTSIVTTDIASCVATALMIAAGKVIFKWIPRIQNIGVRGGAPVRPFNFGASRSGAMQKAGCGCSGSNGASNRMSSNGAISTGMGGGVNPVEIQSGYSCWWDQECYEQNGQVICYNFLTCCDDVNCWLAFSESFALD